MCLRGSALNGGYYLYAQGVYALQCHNSCTHGWLVSYHVLFSTRDSHTSNKHS